MLKFLWELKPTADPVSPVEGLKAKVADLEGRIAKMKVKIKEKGLDSLYDTLAELEGEHKAAVKELEQAQVPRSDTLAVTQGLIAQLKDAGDDDGLRRSLRQQVRSLVRVITVDHIEGQVRNSNKTVFLSVELESGERRLVCYRTNRQGLVSAAITDAALGDRWSEEDYGPLSNDEGE